MDAAHRGVTALVERGQGEPIQAKEQGGTPDVPQQLPGRGGGAEMPEDVRVKMETAFGADFSAVRVHEGSQATAMGALAYTQGTDIHFAPGQYQPQSQSGQALLGHELTHVVQQSQGKVQATTQAKGVDINDDASLEREADDHGARAARGEKVGGAGAAPIAARASSGGSVQRYAFVNDTQVQKDARDLTPEMLSLVKDDLVRSYTSLDEFKQHASKSTDYLGNLSDGTWLRFSPTGINLLGENHTLVTLDQVAPAVNSKSFIYEPFSSDDLQDGSKLKESYESENAGRFKTFGVDQEKDKKQFGAESLFPKMGYGMTLALPFFNGSAAISGLKKAGYVGQPVQRYLKLAWSHSQDNKAQVNARLAKKEEVPPKQAALATVHAAVEAKLDPFISALPVDGFLGDALEKPGMDKLLPLLAEFALAFSEAMVEMAATDPSSRLDPAARKKLGSAKSTSEGDKRALFGNWRDYKFEDAVADATKRGVRYAGMGQNHLLHLESVGLAANQHPYKMADKDLTKFKDRTSKLAKAAVKQ